MRSGYLKNQRYTGLTHSPSGCSIVPSVASPVDAASVDDAPAPFDADELFEVVVELFELEELLLEVD